MTTLDRRRFLRAGGLATTGLALADPLQALGRDAVRSGVIAEAEDTIVRLGGDGLGLSPAQYARLLTRLADQNGINPDSYTIGGVAEELETAFARALGKERAVFMPTGTLANHMAVRALAGGPSRVIVQEESHLQQDEGDCAQTLSGLTLIPLAPGRATFTAADVQRVVDQTKSGRVMSRVSVISIETPVRRRQGESFDSAEIQKIVALAKREGIRLHLDGARLFLQSAYTGEDVAETSRPFDTVYVSLYKYFNAASGAILAGPRDLIDGMFHGRRMFGGGLQQAWPFAAVALHYLAGFSERFRDAVRASENLVAGLSRHDAFAIERIPSGTNLFRLRLRGGDAASFRQRLAAQGVMLPAPNDNAFLIGVNETLNRRPAPELVQALVRATAA